jgi:predicted DNA-binding transcriptional regulator YafY
MLNPAARLLRLLSLLQTHREWSGSELAARLDVGIRTVRRDIEKLRELGYPVRAAAGVAGYRLSVGAIMPPLLLDDEEAVAVALELATATGGAVIGVQEAALRALAKLEQAMPARLRHRVAALRGATVAMSQGGTAVDPATLTMIAGAIRDHHQLRFDYRAYDGTPSCRTAEPYKLVHTGYRWYLFGWDLDRADWRTYRLDRLLPKVPGGRAFAPRRTPDDIAEFVSQGISSAPYPYQAQILLQAPIAAAAALIAPTTGFLEADGEHSCLLRFGANSLNDLTAQLCQFDFGFRVLGPPELAGHVRRKAERLAAAASP